MFRKGIVFTIRRHMLNKFAICLFLALISILIVSAFRLCRKHHQYYQSNSGEDKNLFAGGQLTPFITTPEAFHSLDNWMKYRKDCGENITENSWVMRNLWDVTMPKGKGVVTIPKKLRSTGVKRLIENALWA